MGQHRPLGNACCAAGILQEGNVVAGESHRFHRKLIAACECGAERDGVIDMPVRHHLFHLLDQEVDDPALWCRQQVADLRGDDVFHRRVGQHLLQGVGKILDDDDELATRILELMFKFARRVEWIDVHYRHAGTQDTEQCHRVLQQVGRHDCHAVALCHSWKRLQEGRKGTGLPFQFGIVEGDAKVMESWLVTKLAKQRVEHCR